ncbi:MAG: PD-(D/E)XK nuclease family protein [Nitrospinae bacterium]|nr:PD-(D/E)XK nuclease family protein [Nitrospinota bacterium]
MSHISFSELKNWNFCPFYHKLTYIDKLKGFRGNEYTAFGTAIHDVCEKKLLQEQFEAPEYFMERFEESLSELDSDIEFREDLENMTVQALGILPEIMPAVAEYFESGYEVISTEEQLMVPIEGEDYNFKGYIDAVVKTPDGKYHIIDWKSCSWGWDMRRRSDPMVTYQLTLYKIFFAQKHGIELKNIETHFALLKRTAKKSRVEIFRVTSGNKKMENASSLLKKALFNIKRKNYIKDKRSCAKCDFCRSPECP